MDHRRIYIECLLWLWWTIAVKRSVLLYLMRSFLSYVQGEEKEGTMWKGIFSTYFAANTLEVSFPPLQR